MSEVIFKKFSLKPKAKENYQKFGLLHTLRY